jgi:hypothetical protein
MVNGWQVLGIHDVGAMLIFEGFYQFTRSASFFQ